MKRSPLLLALGWAALLVGAVLAVAADANAATEVKVLATDPPGATVVLARNQNFYLRIGYTTDTPVKIWARPYFRGKEVNAGSNPSRTYMGAGEALGWFFFMQPGEAVDEIRINAGDGTRGGTRLVATYPVHIVGGSEPGAARTEPSWVVEMKRSRKTTNGG